MARAKSDQVFDGASSIIFWSADLVMSLRSPVARIALAPFATVVGLFLMLLIGLPTAIAVTALQIWEGE